MGKLSLKADTTFQALVKIPRLGQEPADVTFTFKHRTRDEFQALEQRDSELLKRVLAGEEVELPPDEEKVMELACGWDLDDAFTVENVRALCQHYIGACPAIVKAYGEAFAKARLGN